MIVADRPVLVFDGDCGGCTRSAHAIEARWRRPARAISSQRLGTDGLADLGLTEADAAAAAWWVDEANVAHRGHRAIARALLAAGTGERIVGRLLLVPPVSWLAAVAYRWVAAHREVLPGATDACRVDSSTP